MNRWRALTTVIPISLRGPRNGLLCTKSVWGKQYHWFLSLSTVSICVWKTISLMSRNCNYRNKTLSIDDRWVSIVRSNGFLLNRQQGIIFIQEHQLFYNGRPEWVCHISQKAFLYGRVSLTGINELTHCVLVMPYGHIDHGKHWLRKWLATWQHQAIAWTNVDLSSLKSHAILYTPGCIWLEILKALIIWTCCKFTHLKLRPYSSGTINYPWIWNKDWSPSRQCSFRCCHKSVAETL